MSDGEGPGPTILAGSERYAVERARAEDVPALAALLRDDPIGATREPDDLAPYERAFGAIDEDPNQFLAVVRDPSTLVVGTMQLTLLPGLSRGGATRLQVEAVRIAAVERGQGLGASMLAWAHEWGRAHGATLAQLTTDKSRVEAHRFYERLGYEASHEGMKLRL